MADTYDQRWIYLRETEADEIKTVLAASVFLDPLDYDGCLELGVWRRLERGDRKLPRAAGRIIGQPAGTQAQSRKWPAPAEVLLGEEEVEHLLAELGILQISVAIGLSRPSGEELAAAGLELAVLMGRRRFVGAHLVQLIRRRRIRVSKND